MQSKKHAHACKEGEDSISFTNMLLISQGMSMCVYMFICSKNRAKQILILQKQNAYIDMLTTLKPNYFTYGKID